MTPGKNTATLSIKKKKPPKSELIKDESKKKNKVWVISVDGGYGHARAAYPLKDIAYNRIITANSDKIVSPKEKKLWISAQSAYEWLSRASELPLVGKLIWGAYDHFQAIEPAYPIKDRSFPTLSTLLQYRLIKKGICKSLINHIKRTPLPIFTTYFTPAYAAYLEKLSPIYCLVTDTDINRAWVALNPRKSTIIYFAPTKQAARRLLQYGVPREKLIYSGFPLPKENLGGPNLPIAKNDLAQRLVNLDPKRKYLDRYQPVIVKGLAPAKLPPKPNRPLTILYAIGGAGAQKSIAEQIISSMREKLINREVRLFLSAGTRLDVVDYFREICWTILGIEPSKKSPITIISSLTKRGYFELFNQALRESDVLWTKPSELVFYTALGLPIIIAPPLGSHEVFNRNWLVNMGAGYVQEDPKATASWLFDWLRSGMLAEAAWQGFTEAPQQGTYIIEDVLTGSITPKPICDEDIC